MSLRRGPRSSILRAAAFAAVALLHAGEVAADDAIARFDHGRSLWNAGDIAGALGEFEASNKLLPSPNTELLIGHALRRLGRRAEAMTTYEHVIATAGPRVRAGEERFRAALEEAGRWNAVLRAELAEIAISVRGGGRDLVVLVDGQRVAITLDEAARVATATVWHEPGAAVVTMQPSAGGPIRRDVVLEAGRKSDVGLDATPSSAPAKPVTAPPPVDRGASSLPPPASWAAAGIGVAGLVVFAVFEGMATSIADDLAACDPKPCGDDRRDEQDEGKRDEVIAFIGLGVGVLGVATGALLWAIDRPARPPPSARYRPRIGIADGVRVTIPF